MSRHRPLNVRGRLFKGLLTVVQATFLSTGLLVVPVAVAPVLAANPAADIDQCRNGGVDEPFIQCTGPAWQNGNAGAENSHYREGESISYRTKLTNLEVGQEVVLTISYDVIHNGYYAIDYLTDKNRWQPPETTVAATPDLPTSGYPSLGTDPVLAPIPAPPGSIQVDPTADLGEPGTTGSCIDGGSGALQPLTSFNAVPEEERVMEFFGVSGTPEIEYVGDTPDFSDVQSGGDQQQAV